MATGPKHNDRSVAQIGLVNFAGQPLLNLYVRPAEDARVVSYLTPLTGLTRDHLYGPQALPLAEALQVLRKWLPRDAVLVGQNIRADVLWLGLAEGADFGSMLDLSALFRVWDGAKYAYFGQDHVAAVWLGVTTGPRL